MRDLHGKNIGTTINFRRFGTVTADSLHEARHPWPEDTTVSAGNGVVFVRDGENYETLFMEVYPPGADFIRGEGPDPAACEQACWEKYQRALHCPSGGDHEWESRGYKNGAGFCRHCGTFRSKVFTGDDLGQHCRVCGTGTTWHWDEDGFLCEQHTPKRYDEDLASTLERLTGGRS